MLSQFINIQFTHQNMFIMDIQEVDMEEKLKLSTKKLAVNIRIQSQT
jgi:hypothetical protein